MRKNSTMEPSLSDLILLIDEETTLLNDPCSQEMLFHNIKRRTRSMTERKR